MEKLSFLWGLGFLKLVIWPTDKKCCTFLRYEDDETLYRSNQCLLLHVRQKWWGSGGYVNRPNLSILRTPINC